MGALARGGVAEGDKHLKTTRKLYQLRVVDARRLENFFATLARLAWDAMEVAVPAVRVRLAQECSADQTLKVEATPLT